MENEDEINSGHKHSTFRKLDTRIGRFLSVDPAAELYYSWSPYGLSMDNPIANSDPSGATVVPPSLYGQKLEYDGSRGYIGTFVFNAVVEVQNASLGSVDYAHDVWNTAAQGKNPISKIADDIGKSKDALGTYLVTTTVEEKVNDLASIETLEALPSFFLTRKFKLNKAKLIPEGTGSVLAPQANVTYYRVQGGTGTAASKALVNVGADGALEFKSNFIHISVGNLDHAKHFQKLRPGSEIVSFEVPKWFDNAVKEYAIPQKGYKSNPNNQGMLAPQIVDPTTPGTSYGLPKEWGSWLQENHIPNSGKVVK